MITVIMFVGKNKLAIAGSCRRVMMGRRRMKVQGLFCMLEYRNGGF
jgi:hypothetical protein